MSLLDPGVFVSALPSEVPSPTQMLERIFGVDVTQFTSILTGGSETLLGGVATVTSTAAVFFTAVLIVYTVLTQLITAATAKEGQGITMSGWWAVRWAIALGLMIPTPSGYNVFQGLILYGAGQGSNLATAAWDRTEEKFIDNSSIQSQTGVNAVKFGAGTQTINSLYRLALCEAVADKGDAEQQQGVFTSSLAVNPVSSTRLNPASLVAAYANNFGTSFMKTQINVRSMDGVGSLPVGVCGSAMWLTISQSNDDGMEAAVRSGIGARVDMALTQLRTIAKQEVNNGWTEALRADAVRRVADGYTRNAQEATMNVLRARGGTAAQNMLAKYRNDTEDAGWIAAGAFMWSYNASIARTLELGRMGFAVGVSEPDVSNMPAFFETEYSAWKARADLGASRQMSQGNSGGSQGSDTIDVDMPSFPTQGAVQLMVEKARKSFANIMLGLIKFGTLGSAEEGNDPLIGLQTAGNRAMIAGEAAMVSSGVVRLAVASPGLAGQAPLVAGGLELGKMLHEFLWAVGLYLLIAGGFLALYLPALPLILWIGGLISWFLMVIETVLVAPLWLAAHAMPEGEGIAGQHAKQGYSLMIGLIARPILMVGGLIAAVLLARVMLSVSGSMFGWFIDLVWSDGLFGPISAAGVFAIYAFTMVYVTRQCFSLIHLVPDRALRFIGSGDSLGDGVREHGVYGGVMGSFAVLRSIGIRQRDSAPSKSKNSISGSP